MGYVIIGVLVVVVATFAVLLLTGRKTITPGWLFELFVQGDMKYIDTRELSLFTGKVFGVVAIVMVVMVIGSYFELGWLVDFCKTLVTILVFIWIGATVNPLKFVKKECLKNGE